MLHSVWRELPCWTYATRQHLQIQAVQGPMVFLRVMMQCTVCWHDQCEPTGDSCPAAGTAAWKQASSGGRSSLSILSFPLSPHSLLPRSFLCEWYVLKGRQALLLGCQCCLHSADLCQSKVHLKVRRQHRTFSCFAVPCVLVCDATAKCAHSHFCLCVSQVERLLTNPCHKLDMNAKSLIVYCHGSFQWLFCKDRQRQSGEMWLCWVCRWVRHGCC